jgi:hypothetical protein
MNLRRAGEIVMAILGGTTMVAGLRDYLLRRAKIKGKILYVQADSVLASEPRSTRGLSKAFDCEIILLVSAVNIHSQPTTVSTWALDAGTRGRRVQAYSFDPESKEPAWTQLTREMKSSVVLHGHPRRFSQNIEQRGWLAFRFEGMQRGELLSYKEMRLTATDARGRRHHIEVPVPPSEGPTRFWSKLS